MPVPVYLVTMPFAELQRPSLALGLLKAGLARRGIASTVHYANLDFAERIGLAPYSWFGDAHLVGEWAFAAVLDPGRVQDDKEYLARYASTPQFVESFDHLMPGTEMRLKLREIRASAGPFVEDLAQAIARARPLIVGCTSTFFQNCASLALLRRIRELDDSIITVMGGANCEGTVGLTTQRAFPWVDFVVSGEADLLFPDLVQLLMTYGRAIDPRLLPYGVIGVGALAASSAAAPPRAVVANLDQIPVPDFDDYFARLARSPYAGTIRPGLPVETSRGCWWAAQGPCTFCGENGSSLSYRAKSPDRIVQEFSTLSERYHLSNFLAADNALNPSNQGKVFPRLQGKGYSIFAELRVTDNRRLEELAQGGVRWIQVGIESFHDDILRLMHKGSRAVQNIWILRRALELGIQVSYNLLYGFPGERDEWYVQMAELFPSLFHLQPPSTMSRVSFVRYSTYHDKPERYGLKLVPNKEYSYIYNLPPGDIQGLAQTFEDEYAGAMGKEERPGLALAESAWNEWQRCYLSSKDKVEQSFLHQFTCGNELLVYDTRPCARDKVKFLDPAEAALLSFFDHPRRLSMLAQYRRETALRLSAHECSRSLEDLIDRKYLLRIGDEALNLVARSPKERMLSATEFPGGYYDPAPAPPIPQP